MGEVVEQDVGIYLINSDIHFPFFAYRQKVFRL